MMKSTMFAAAAGAAFAFSVGVVGATDLPSPPWVPPVACPPGNMGCSQVPPDKDALKVSATVGKIVSKGTASGLKCFSKGITNLVAGKGKGGADGGLADCTADFQAKLLTSAAKTIGKLSDMTKPTAPYVSCVATNALAIIQPTLTNFIPDLLPIALCEGSTDLEPQGYGGPSSISGTNSMQPSDKDIAKVELAVISASAKFGTATTKCLDKGVGNLLKGKPGDDGAGGALICLTDPTKSPAAKLQSSLTKIGTKALGQPACLFDAGGQANLTAGAAAIAETSTLVDSLLYCNS